MEKILGLVIGAVLVLFLITIFFVLWKLNRKIPRPDIGEINPEDCQGCTNKSCGYKH